MPTKKDFFQFVKLGTLALLLILGAGALSAAWVGPSGVPTSANVNPPIHTGSATQTKAGALLLPILQVTGDTYTGRYCFGTIASPSNCISSWSAALPASGSGGNVLTSNGTGWVSQAPTTYVRSSTTVGTNFPSTVTAICDAGDVATGGGIGATMSGGIPGSGISVPSYVTSSTSQHWGVATGAPTQAPNSWSCEVASGVSIYCFVICEK